MVSYQLWTYNYYQNSNIWSFYYVAKCFKFSLLLLYLLLCPVLAHSSLTSHSHNTQWFTENSCSDGHRQCTCTEWLFYQIKLCDDVNLLGDFEILLKFVKKKNKIYFFLVSHPFKFKLLSYLIAHMQTNTINEKIMSVDWWPLTLLFT